MTIAVLLTLCAGALPVYAEDSGSITLTPSRTILTVGQTISLIISTTPADDINADDVDITITDNVEFYTVLEYNDTYNTLTGLHKGTAVVTATGTNTTTGETVTASVTIVVGDSLGLIDNINYYIMNRGTGRDLALSTNSDANGVSIDSRLPSDSPAAQWTVVKNTDGTIRLQSVYSSTGRSAYVSGTNLVLYNNTGARTKLTIMRVESGIYQGLYQIRYNNQLLCMNSSGDVYFDTVLGANAHWCFLAVDKGVADIISHDYTYTDDEGQLINFNTTHNDNKFVELFEDLGYAAYSTVNFQAYYAYLYMRTEDDIFVFNGHGNAGIISFTTTNNESTGAIAVCSSVAGHYPVGSDRYYINSCEANELASLRCVLYLGCSTGVDITVNRQTYNLVDATFDKGAHFVLGTTNTILTSDSNEWLGFFLDRIDAGDSIEEACDYATEYTGVVLCPYDKEDGSTGYDELPAFPLYIVGDGAQYLE